MNNCILYLTYDGLTDPLGQSQILPYLEGLAEKGHEITVISFEKGKKLKSEGLKVDKEGSKLKIIPLQYHKTPPVLSTLYDINLLKKAVKNVLRNQQIDIIHCRSYITSLVGLWVKRKFGVKFIFDMRGFWADERVEGGVWNLNNPLFRWVYNYFKRKEKQFIVEADAIVSLTDNAKQEIESWMVDASIAERITVIPTCADLDHFSASNISVSETDFLRNKYGLQKDDFVLLYLGSLGTWYMLEEMLDFYEELKTERKKLKGTCRFLFVTRDQEELREALKDRKFLNDEIIFTSSSREDVPKYISLCSASIFFIIPTYSKKASAATKMGEIMAMGKPVITNTGWGDVDEILSQKNGVVIKSFDKKDYKKGICELDESLIDDPDIIRQIAEKYFSLENGVIKFHQIYQKLKKE